MPPQARKTAVKKVRRKEKKNVAVGQAHIKSTFNNTIVSITDPQGNVVSWASAGHVGFKGSRKSTPFAAQMAAENAARKAQEHGLRKVDVFVKGPGSGRETAIRSLQATGLEVGLIQDVTPQPHNGCRPKKPRRIYGVLEKQFRGYYEEANRKTGKTGEVLLQILESRLDNVIYRAGFAESRDMARQLVRHGHILVNGRKVDIPSYRVSENDIIEVAEKSRTMLPFEIAQARAGERPVPPWLEVISSQLRVLVHSVPARQVIDTPVQEQLIVELYSK